MSTQQRKKIRVGVIVETKLGPLIVSDPQDKGKPKTLEDLNSNLAAAIAVDNITRMTRYRLAITQMADQGRYALPGGGILPEDYETANATILLNKGKVSIKDDPYNLFLQVLKTTASREVKEELGLILDPQHIKYLWPIKGRQRYHHIFLAHALPGVMKLKKDEVGALAFMNKQAPFVFGNRSFFQYHLRVIFHKYLLSGRRNYLARNYLSNLYMSQDIADDVFRNAEIAYHFFNDQFTRPIPYPKRLETSPNFVIYDPAHEDLLQQSLQPEKLLGAIQAKLLATTSGSGR